MVDCMDIVSYKIYNIGRRYDVSRCKGMNCDIIATSFTHESAVGLMNYAATKDCANGQVVVIDRV